MTVLNSVKSFFNRWSAPMALSAGLALSGCATRSFNPDNCSVEEGTQVGFLFIGFQASNGRHFDNDCQLGKAAAMTVGLRGPDGRLIPIAPAFDKTFKEKAPPEALKHYDYFKKLRGISDQELAETEARLQAARQGPPPKPATDGMLCTVNSAGLKVCRYQTSSP